MFRHLKPVALAVGLTLTTLLSPLAGGSAVHADGLPDLVALTPEGPGALQTPNGRGSYLIRVRNSGSAPATSVELNVRVASFPVDATGFNFVGNSHGFACQLAAASARPRLDEVKLRCSGGTLNPNEEVRGRLDLALRSGSNGFGSLILTVDPDNRIAETIGRRGEVPNNTRSLRIAFTPLPVVR